jgi:hypothetical protein
LAISTVLLVTVGCYGDDTASACADLKSTVSVPQVRELIVAVHINGQAASEFAVLLQDEAHYYASEHDFREWRLRRPAGPPLTNAFPG